jgi:hypothetical protein
METVVEELNKPGDSLGGMHSLAKEDWSQKARWVSVQEGWGLQLVWEYRLPDRRSQITMPGSLKTKSLDN